MLCYNEGCQKVLPIYQMKKAVVGEHEIVQWFCPACYRRLGFETPRKRTRKK